MISKIIPASVFTPEKQEAEELIRIACGTNDLGINDPEGGSVAGQIAKNYLPDFSELGERALGNVHVRDFDFDGVQAQAMGIVCNIPASGKWLSENDSDWGQAVAAVRKGFEEIANIAGISATRGDVVKNLRDGAVNIGMSENDFTVATELQALLEEYRNTINPIVRSVLIGSGKSGFENDANVAGILQSMHESSANIHLYLQAEGVRADLARIIPLFPATYAIQKIPGYKDILVAA